MGTRIQCLLKTVQKMDILHIGVDIRDTGSDIGVFISLSYIFSCVSSHNDISFLMSLTLVNRIKDF